MKMILFQIVVERGIVDSLHENIALFAESKDDVIPPRVDPLKKWTVGNNW